MRHDKNKGVWIIACKEQQASVEKHGFWVLFSSYEGRYAVFAANRWGSGTIVGRSPSGIAGKDRCFGS